MPEAISPTKVQTVSSEGLAAPVDAVNKAKTSELADEDGKVPDLTDEEGKSKVAPSQTQPEKKEKVKLTAEELAERKRKNAAIKKAKSVTITKDEDVFDEELLETAGWILTKKDVPQKVFMNIKNPEKTYFEDQLPSKLALEYKEKGRLDPKSWTSTDGIYQEYEWKHVEADKLFTKKEQFMKFVTGKSTLKVSSSENENAKKSDLNESMDGEPVNPSLDDSFVSKIRDAANGVSSSSVDSEVDANTGGDTGMFAQLDAFNFDNIGVGMFGSLGTVDLLADSVPMGSDDVGEAPHPEDMNIDETEKKDGVLDSKSIGEDAAADESKPDEVAVAEDAKVEKLDEPGTVNDAKDKKKEKKPSTNMKKRGKKAANASSADQAQAEGNNDVEKDSRAEKN